MLTSKCPKCGSSNIVGPYRTAGQVKVRVVIKFTKSATLDSYACTNCGYIEFYADRLGLRNLRRHGRLIMGEKLPKIDEVSQKNRQESSIFVFCDQCGKTLASRARFCQNCGSEVLDTVDQEKT